MYVMLHYTTKDIACKESSDSKFAFRSQNSKIITENLCYTMGNSSRRRFL